MDPTLGRTLYLESAKIGQLLVVSRKTKRWAGLCLGIKKNSNAHILQLDTVYHWVLNKVGLWEEQIGFTQQIVRFKRTPDTEVKVWQDGVMPGQPQATAPELGPKVKPSARREFRKAYRGVRTHLMVERQHKSEHFAYLNLTEEVTPEEFKAKRREVMLQWHPDRLFVFVSEGGTEDQFKVQSDRALLAISWVTQFLANKGVRV